MDHIAIIGKMCSGKTTLANAINKNIYENKGCITSFAGPIKEIYENRELLSSYIVGTKEPLSLDNVNVLVDRSKSLIEHEPFMNILKRLDDELKDGDKPRKHYQFIGDFFKTVYGKEFWAKKLFDDFDRIESLDRTLGGDIQALIIDDLRMNIEYETINSRKENFIILCLEVNEDYRREIIKNLKHGDESTFNHNSEIEVDEIISEIKAVSYENMYSYDNDKRMITIHSTKGSINKKILKDIISVISTID
jgi:hypothetical protein